MANDPASQRLRLSDTLFTTIRTSVETDPLGERRVILYTSFGVLRGRVSASAFGESNRHPDARLENTSRVVLDPDLLELDSVTIEHYSNHLPTGNFDRLFVRLTDVQAFAFA